MGKRPLVLVVLAVGFAGLTGSQPEPPGVYQVFFHNTTPWDVWVQVQMYNPIRMTYEIKTYAFAPFERAYLGTTPGRWFLYRARTKDGRIKWADHDGGFKQDDMGERPTIFTESLRYVPDAGAGRKERPAAVMP